MPVMSGCGNSHVRCRWNRRTDRKGKEYDRETHGAAAIGKRTSKQLNTPGDSWRECLRTGVAGRVMLAATAPEGCDEGFGWLVGWLVG